ncbi:ribosome-associated protein [Trypanosoma theileri]|uniref:Ribosome-associated protein n=1 Tax=Trypanosoma theileri TaxID=67003 RepID=A0A1X0P1Z5_9TRYP|nr:ribosome-associated protein [Trypanosoma theileri]ORC90966.1 ribosome-associated protein [Trypanosoma theileri]
MRVTGRPKGLSGILTSRMRDEFNQILYSQRGIHSPSMNMSLLSSSLCGNTNINTMNSKTKSIILHQTINLSRISVRASDSSAMRWWFSRPSLNGAITRLGVWTPNLSNALSSQCARSQISSFKEEGYYRLAKLKDIHIDEDCYSLLTMRGSGPGGQGTNSSSSKVELRVSISALSEHFDEDLIHKLKDNERGKSLTADESLVIVSSHEHRSVHQNKEACLRRLREIIQKASWVPPVEAAPIKRPTSIVTARKVERRKKGSMQKMQRAARKGMW